MYGPAVSLEKVMSVICEGRFNPDAPRTHYWPTALPVCRIPRPVDFQGPGVVPMHDPQGEHWTSDLREAN